MTHELQTVTYRETGNALEESTPSVTPHGSVVILLKHCGILAAILLLVPLLISARAPRFGDLYEVYIITDVEVSEYHADDFEQIDCEEVMAIIAKAKVYNLSFEPAWEMNLYDDEGIRYRLYLSKSCRFLRIDSNYFRLSKRQAKTLLNMFKG